MMYNGIGPFFDLGSDKSIQSGLSIIYIQGRVLAYHPIIIWKYKRHFIHSVYFFLS
jgi:hypothetical protein